jgi:hypothetical protein
MIPDSRALDEQHALAQKTLVDFLQADLDLCFTMLKTAELASDPQHTRSAIGRVRSGLQVIRNLSGRIENPETWTALNSRADELQRALEAFHG